MSAWCGRGAIACLLAVLCLTAGCDASQQQQQPAALFGINADEFLSFISRAVQAELQPILSRLEARVEELDRKLEAQVEDVGRRLVLLGSRLGALDKRMFILDTRVDELTVQLWNCAQQPQPNDISSKFDSQQVRLDEMSTRLDNQTSRLETPFTRQNSQDSHLGGLRSQLAALTNSTTSESRVDGAENETAGQQPQSDEVTIRPDQAEDITKPRECSELSLGIKSGVHLVWPDRSQEPVQAFCQEDIDGGKMWTVFQRRGDIQPRQDFYLGWDAYRQGFGNLTGEFWWGLEHLHKLTASQDRLYQLRVDLEAFNGDKVHATYSSFRVSTEEDGYRLSVSGYTGDAGDSLRPSDSNRFSTRARDNDGWSRGSCAEWRQGAWWYGRCGISNLNGRYLEDGRRYKTGILWLKWRGLLSLKKAQMNIRPA